MNLKVLKNKGLIDNFLFFFGADTIEEDQNLVDAISAKLVDIPNADFTAEESKLLRTYTQGNLDGGRLEEKETEFFKAIIEKLDSIAS